MAGTPIIKLKRSSVAGKAPTTTDLSQGEVAINLADRVIYTKDHNDNIVTLGGNGSGGDVNLTNATLEGETLISSPTGILKTVSAGTGIKLDVDTIPGSIEIGLTTDVAAAVQSVADNKAIVETLTQSVQDDAQSVADAVESIDQTKQHVDQVAASIEGSKEQAATSERLAKEWATKENDPVADGQYSAKHWATVASNAASMYPATETQAGLARFATNQEVIDGVVSNATVSPNTLKPVLDTKLDRNEVGVPGGVAPLDDANKIPAVYLPGFVDEVTEYPSFAELPEQGQSDKIYVTIDTNKVYRWGGSTYVEISAAPGSTDAVPEGVTNLYFTNERAYAASPVKSVAGRTGNVHLSKSDVGLDQVDNTSDLNKPISTATQTALDEKAPIDNPTFTGNVKGITQSMVGLSEVDNTSDLNKPISTATQTALSNKADLDGATFTGKISTVAAGGEGAGLQLTPATTTPPSISLTHGDVWLENNTIKYRGSNNTTYEVSNNVTYDVIGKEELEEGISPEARLISAEAFRHGVLTSPTANPSEAGLMSAADKIKLDSFGDTFPNTTDDLPEGATNLYFTPERVAQVAAVKSVAGKTGEVTLSKSDVGLDQVDNTSDLDKPISTATQAALDEKVSSNNPVFTGVVSGIDKADVGLSNVDNTSDLDKPISTATQAALDEKAPIDSPSFTGNVSGITKGMVGLGNVDNVSDINKPISIATQNALDNKVDISSVGEPGGVVPLNASGKIDISFIPSAAGGEIETTDDLPEGATNLYFTPERVAQVAAVKSVAGKTGEVVLTKDDVGLSNVDNTSDLDKPISTATQAALDEKVSSNNPVFTGVVSGIDKADVGLDQVNNTADLDKPISTATQAALDEKASKNHTHTVDDIAGLQNTLNNKLDISGNALTATKLQTPTKITIGSSEREFDGSEVISWSLLEIGAATVNHIHETATASTDGFMSAVDKAKLDQLVSGSGDPLVTSVNGQVGDVTLVAGDVGLENVDNTSDINKPISYATQIALDSKAPSTHVGAVGDAHGLATTTESGFMSSQDKLKLDTVSSGAEANLVDSVAGKTGEVILTKDDVGLDQVDNTSDASKPISDATQAALDGKVDKVTGKQLSTEDFTAEDKTKLIGIESGAQVNTVNSVAGRTGTITLTKTDVGLANVNNTSDANKPISTATQQALDNKSDKIHTHSEATTTTSGFMSSADKSKLDAIAPGATSNSTDAQLRDRTTHTGQQPISTITNLQTTLDEKFEVSGGTFSGKVVTSPSTTSTAGLNLSPGQDPIAPTYGDMWITGDQFRIRGSVDTFDVATTNTWIPISNEEIALGVAITPRLITAESFRHGYMSAPINTATQTALTNKAPLIHTHTIAEVDGLQAELDNKQTKGSAASSADKLTTAVQIGGVEFDGSQDIDLPGVNVPGNQNTTGSAAKLTTARKISVGNAEVLFDGSTDVSIPLQDVGVAPLEHVHDIATITADGFMSSTDKVKLDDIEAGAQVNTITSVAGRTGAVVLTKADVGLVNVDNTSDLNKPISTATQTALNGKVDSSLIGAANGIVPLDSNSKIASTYLPSFVDEIVEVSSYVDLPAVGESGNIYTTLDTNQIYRWGGTTYVEISPAPGSTDEIAEGTANLYYTDARASAAAPVKSVAGKTGEVILTKGDVGLDQVDNTSDLDKPISTATQAVLDTKAPLANPTFTGTVNGITKAMVGLANVDNTSDLNKPISTATQDALDGKANLSGATFTGKINTMSSTLGGAGINVPVGVTPTVPLTGDIWATSSGLHFRQDGVTTTLATTATWSEVSQLEAQAGTSTTSRLWSAQRVRQAIMAAPTATTTVNGLMSAADKTKLDGIAAGAQVNTVNSVAGKTGAVVLTKADVGLSNVDNTSDLNKPVSTATQAALDDKADAATTLAGYGIIDAAPISHVGSTGNAHGVATTTVAGFMSSADKVKLDAIATGANKYVHPTSGVIAGTYNSVTVNDQGHVTGGTNPTTLAGYGIIDAAPISHVGSTGNAHGVATTTIAGFMSSSDKNKLNAIEPGAQVNTITSVAGRTGAVVLTKADVGLDKVDNTSDLNKPISTATQTALDEKAEAVHTHSNATTTVAGFMSSTDKVKLNSVESGAQVNTITSVAGKTGVVTLTKSDVGLSNVDNTSDANKPISTATQTALNGKANLSGANFTGKVVVPTSSTSSAGLNVGIGTAPSTPVAGDMWISGSTLYFRDASTTRAVALSTTWSTLTQAEAEAGTSTAARLITAQRLRQGVLASPVATPTTNGLMSSADKIKLDSLGGVLPQTTDDLEEGATNLYYTDARASAASPVQSVAGKTGAVVLTKADIGLSNIDNTSDAAKPISTATQTALDGKADSDHTHVIGDVTGLQSALDGKLATTGTAAAATKLATARTIGGVSFDGTANINLPGVNTTGNQNTTGSAAKLTTARTISIAGVGKSFNGSANIAWTLAEIGAASAAHTHDVATITADGFMSADDKVKLDGIESGAQVNTITSVAGKTGAVVLTKTDVGLSNVDNTSDAAKPISTATQTALNGKVNTSLIGAVNGIAPLDSNSKIPSTYLPSFVDDVIEVATYANLPTTGETGKIYTTLDTNQIYRWGGTAYIEISPAPGSTDAVPEGTTNLYYTNARAASAAPVKSVAGKTGVVTLTKSDVGLSNVDNTSDAAKPISTATQTALNLKAPLASPTFTGTVKGITKAMVGLGSVDNTSDLNKPISTATQTALDGKADSVHTHTVVTTTVDGFMSADDKVKLNGIAAGAQVNTITSVAGKTGAVVLTKADVGLSNVDNTSDAAKPISTATQTALDLKAPIASPTFTGTVKGITKAMVGLGSVDNTSDLDKPISTATQTALDGKANSSHTHTIANITGLQTALDGKLATTGTAAAATKLATARTIGGVSFDGTANITLPGVNAVGNQNTTGSAAKLTTARTLTIGSTGKTFDGSANVAWSLAEIGAAATSHTHTTATTTVDGFMSSADKVKLNGIAAGAQVNTITSVAGKTGAVTLTKSDVGLANVDNTSDAAKPISTATQTALDGKADLVGASFSGKINTAASTVTEAGLNLAHGVAPTAPVSGDMWTTTSGLYVRLGSTTRTMVHTGTWSTVSQTEAEAGTSTTARLWTAQRVRQSTMAAPVATTTTNGLMALEDKTYLESLKTKHVINSVDDGLNTLQVVGGTRTDTLAVGTVQNANESIDTDGNIKVRGEGQLILGDFAIQYNSTTKSLDFNYIGV